MKPSLVLCAVTMAAVAVLTGGCGAGQSTAVQAALVQPVSTGIPAQHTTSTANTAATRSAGALPASVRIPRIGAESTLIPLGQNPDGSVEVPPVSTPLQAGWYAGGAAPGETGPAVLLGHVDGDSQEGIFFRLHELTKGDQVQVTRADGSVLTFRVTKVDRVAKDAFPTTAVYGATKDPELRLLTCGGAFDQTTHHYVDNWIVYATLAA
jgi:LPXTG-site transpeptidase (sortase) family protein